MTLDEYIVNPMGKGNAVYSQRFVYEELYTKKFNLLVAREAGIWQTQLIIANEREYYFYIQIPSESVEHFFWDTVIQFTTKDGELEKSPSLKNYDIKFFSNDPAFMFNFAKAAYNNAENHYEGVCTTPKLQRACANIEYSALLLDSFFSNDPSQLVEDELSYRYHFMQKDVPQFSVEDVAVRYEWEIGGGVSNCPLADHVKARGFRKYRCS